jgi:hypothetical protein
MKKQLNTAMMENELKGGSVFFQKPANAPNKGEKNKTPSPLPSLQETSKAKPRQVRQSEAEREVSQPLDQSIDLSTDQSTKQLIGRTVNRPVAFYIPEVINKKIDEAMQYYQDKRRMKFDRSAIVSAILGDPKLWTHKSLDELIDNVTEQLTSRLTNRLSD